MLLKTGDKAPDFSLPDSFGIVHHLSDYRGKYLLLYFYPKDDTPGCSKEACSFRDSFSEFGARNIVIVGISKDNVNSHKKFTEKYSLPFTILSDIEKKTIQDYDVLQTKKFMGKEYLGIMRTSYLINPKGEIIKIYENVNPLTHADEIKKDISSLN